MNLTQSEENYLKGIYKIAERTGDQNSSTNQIATELGTTAASVTDMIKKLSEKGLVLYEKYYGVSLSKEGSKIAIQLIRKHRLWEVFLFEKLKFSWDQIHDIAEQLEHVKSDELINRLENFIGNPKFDPHGDPIPNQSGSFTYRSQSLLSNITEKNTIVTILRVRSNNSDLLKYLDTIQVKPGNSFTIKNYVQYTRTLTLVNENNELINLGYDISNEIIVKPHL